MSPNDADRMANSVDPDQEQSDLGLHCLPGPVCPKTLENYGIYFLENAKIYNCTFFATLIKCVCVVGDRQD